MSFYIFPNAISKKDCKAYLDYCLNNSTFTDATIIKEGFSDAQDTLGRTTVVNKRKTQVSFITDKDNIMNVLVWGFIRQANKKYFNYKLSHFQPIQFARYEDGGHYDWHQDSSHQSIGDECRKLSLTMSLTDHNEYDGGLLQFYNGDIPYKHKGYSIEEDIKQVGTVIVFDSRDWHRVTPVTKGVRYSIVCWTVGPNFI